MIMFSSICTYIVKSIILRSAMADYLFSIRCLAFFPFWHSCMTYDNIGHLKLPELLSEWGIATKTHFFAHWGDSVVWVSAKWLQLHVLMTDQKLNVKKSPKNQNQITWIFSTSIHLMDPFNKSAAFVMSSLQIVAHLNFPCCVALMSFSILDFSLRIFRFRIYSISQKIHFNFGIRFCCGQRDEIFFFIIPSAHCLLENI